VQALAHTADESIHYSEGRDAAVCQIDLAQFCEMSAMRIT